MQQQYEEWEVEEMILLELRLVFILGVRVSVFSDKNLIYIFQFDLPGRFTTRDLVQRRGNFFGP